MKNEMEVMPYAEHLNLEEVDYELAIRGKLNERVAVLDLGNKQRQLRALFKEDVRSSRTYESPYEFQAEYDYVKGRVTDLIRAISRDGILPRYASRILHYWYRIKRCKTESETERRSKDELIDHIEGVMEKWNIGSFAALDRRKEVEVQTKSTLIASESWRLPRLEENATSEPRSSTPKGLGAIPKASKADHPEVNDHLEQTNQRISHLERAIEGMTKLLERQSMVEQPKPEQAVENRHDTKRSRKSGFFSTQEKSSSEDEDEQEHNGRRSMTNHPLNAPSRRFRRQNDDYSYAYDSFDSDRSPLRRREPPVRQRRRDERPLYGARDHLNRVEKWKIRFTGDSRSVTVENFLYKLKKSRKERTFPNDSF